MMLSRSKTKFNRLIQNDEDGNPANSKEGFVFKTQGSALGKKR